MAQQGGETREGFLAVCQCGGTALELSATRTAVQWTCAACGLRGSVKGSLARVRVPTQEIDYALQHAIVRPEPPAAEAAPSTQAGDDGAPADPPPPKARTLRFTLQADQYAVVDRALEVGRIVHLAEGSVRTQVWQGLILEYICADYLAGADQRALGTYEAMVAAIETAQARHGGPLPARKHRQIWADTRDREAQAQGLVAAAAPYVPPAAAPGEQETRAALDALPPPAPPDGRLEVPADQLPTLVTDFVRGLNSVGTGVRIGGPMHVAQFRQRAAAQGEVVLRLQGDPRTRTPAGLTPAVWICAADPEWIGDLQLFYADTMCGRLEDPELEVEVVQ